MWKKYFKARSARSGGKSAPPSFTASSVAATIPSPAALESNSQERDQRDARKSELEVPPASSPWASKGMRAIRTFSIDSEDIDPWAMKEQLDKYPGAGHWELKVDIHFPSSPFLGFHHHAHDYSNISIDTFSSPIKISNR
jgi:hypothetical protein